ncbi:family 43 glycosylhydrolase [Granulicella aggregans]|uniref:family 43 glycosylhydrolase n=1 Tax=Granulicella aggregans TaxID=474949 RepID=UPI0021E06BE1|nr:family 43 glycosylhydrolase [Granulicella aggregans]
MKRQFERWLVAGVLSLASSTLCVGQDVIRPGDPWLDSHGQRIQAHGGGVTLYKDVYYWFGEDRTPSNDPDKRYVACYSSRDLVHWESRGQVLVLADPERLGPHWVLERPKVFVGRKGAKFVMYAHLDDAPYKLARVMVAVSDRIDGQYKYVKSFRPLGEESRDIGQFVDDDGSAYLIFESRPTKGFFVAKLTDDLMNVEKTAFIAAPLEGGALVHYGGFYYVVGSHMTGWRPNPNVYATASTLAGPWTEFSNLAAQEVNNYDSQSAMLLKVAGSKGTMVIFMGDLWRPHALWDSRYLWMPLEMGSRSMHLPPPQPWSLNVRKGETSLRSNVVPPTP